MALTDFTLHSSPELVKLFRQQPYQGQDPQQARVVFLSSAANYSRQLSQHRFFRRVLEYHQQPINFWRSTGVHHPFMLKEYPFDRRMEGVPFHCKFASMDLGAELADQISFVELLDVATTGLKNKDRKQFKALANHRHLDYLRSLFTDGQDRIIFVSSTVLDDLKYLDGRRWQDLNLWCKSPLRQEDGLPLIYQRGGTKVFKMTSFSGNISKRELGLIRNKIVAVVGH